MSGYLVETNVLVYANDPSDAGKRAPAVALLERLEIRFVNPFMASIQLESTSSAK